MKKFLKSHRTEIIVLSLLVIIKFIYFKFCLKSSFTIDTNEFLACDGFAWIFGKPDRYRLPVYPMVIDICEFIFGPSYITALFLGQFAVSVLSVFALYLTLKKLIPRPVIYLGGTVLYGLSSSVINWDKIVLTESLSISLTVFVVFGLVYYIKENKLRYLAVAICASGIGAFLRAVFAVYSGLIFGFIILKMLFTEKETKEEKRKQRIADAKALCFSVIPVVLLVVYGSMFYRQYGAFTLSDSWLGQHLYIVLNNEYYLDSTDEELKAVAEDFLSSKPPQTINSSIDAAIDGLYGESLTNEQEESIKAAITAYITEDELLDESYISKLREFFLTIHGKDSTARFDSIYLARCYIMENFDRERIANFVSESKNANLKEYLLSLRDATSYMLSCGYEKIQDGNISSFIYTFVNSAPLEINLNVLQGILIGLTEFVLFIFILLNKKRIDWLHLGFSAFILSTCFISIFGTNAEFGRTAITIYPMLFIVITMWMNKIFNISKKDVH